MNEVKIRDANVDVLAIAMDVTSESSVNAAIDQTVNKFGCIDIAVNNAGISGPRGDIDEVSFEDWTSAVNTNLNGVWLCLRGEIKQMSKQQYYSTSTTNL